MILRVSTVDGLEASSGGKTAISTGGCVVGERVVGGIVVGISVVGATVVGGIVVGVRVVGTAVGVVVGD